MMPDRQYHVIPELHLKVSMRSFRSEKQAAFVKALLDCNKEEATHLYQELNEKYPIAITRNLDAYRVLLTRSRQGMIIYVPTGNPYDPTTAPELYDSTFEYLKSIGIQVV